MSENKEGDLSPRTTPRIIGHEKGAEIFLRSFQSGRLHHAWLLAGPKGIGKATLAFHLARFLLKFGNEGGGGLFAAEEDYPKPDLKSLELNTDDPVFTRVASGGEGNLKLIERGVNEKTNRRRTEIVVDDVRALHDFFEMTASRAGWRIAIIDPADEMNRSAANALLKMLEEPPSKSILFLISHAKGKLAPTIRSRCQQLLLGPLSEEQVVEVLKLRLPDLPEAEAVKLAKLSSGSPGLAIRLSVFGGEDLFALIKGVLSGERLTTKEAHDFASSMALAQNEDKYFLFLDILVAEIAAKIRSLAATGVAKTRLDCWLKLWDKIDRIVHEGEGLNLGRRQMLLVLLAEMAAAGKAEHRAA